MQHAQSVANLLAELIAMRTDNPGGDEVSLCRDLARRLEAFGADSVIVEEVPRDSGIGAYVFARFGTPRLIVNAHVDTVPANTGWSRDPWQADIGDARVTGLGAADTKGAIATVLGALAHGRPRDLGVLFSGDEERGSTCMRAFLASEHARGIERAIVCEPSARRAGVRHRGILAYRARFRGQGGHSSKADAMPKPLVTLAHLAIAMDELGRSYLEVGPDDMRGLCMNVADLRGGVAFNVVPDAAELCFSLRPPPGFDAAAFAARLGDVISAVDPSIELLCDLDHPPFSCREPERFRELVGAHIDDFGPVDYWTEAALLSAAGVDAIVLGPGDIAQAHAADEHVSLADLDWATQIFCDVFSSHARP